MPGTFPNKKNVAEAAEIKVMGDRVHRVVLDFESKKTIQRHCYAPTEAGFLSLVAPHGGDFVSRQFDAWIGVERGKRSEDFLTDLLDRGHGRGHVFAHNGRSVISGSGLSTGRSGTRTAATAASTSPNPSRPG